MRDTIKRATALGLAAVLFLAGCATFGIQGASLAEVREGVDCTLLVKAWDKKADSLDVLFSYRVNGGAWKEARGVFNGSLFQAVVPGTEVQPGFLEYYASMVNAKGKTVSSKRATIRVLTFAQAREKAEREYQARLSDGGGEREILYDEDALFALHLAGSDAPAAVRCDLSSPAGPLDAPVRADAGGRYVVELPAPHSAQSYSYQWTVTWDDPVFGEIVSRFPGAPGIAPVLDAAAIARRIRDEFPSSIRATGPVSGTYFDPPELRADFDYGRILAKYSTGPRQVSLMLRNGDFTKIVPMSSTLTGSFATEIPREDLERGGSLTYAYIYSDTFLGAGYVQAQYPSGKGFLVSYKSLEDFRIEAAEGLSARFDHQPPREALEGSTISLRVDLGSPGVDVVSMSLDAVGGARTGGGISFIRQGDAWFAAIPGPAARPGILSYRIDVVVLDRRLGDLQVTLPAKGFYSIDVRSIAQARAEREAEIRKSCSHRAPSEAARNEPLTIVLSRERALPGAVASLFFKTAESSRYRELRASASEGAFAFTIPASETNTRSIQYYFVVSDRDPELGLVAATIRDSGGKGGDFIVTTAEKPAAGGGSASGAPGQGKASAPADPAQGKAPSPAGGAAASGGSPPEDRPKVLSYFDGTEAGRAGVKFSIELDRELGLYEASTMVKVLGVDRDFRPLAMARTGKTYSVTLATGTLRQGSRVEYYYLLSRKGDEPMRIAGADGAPFSLTVR